MQKIDRISFFNLGLILFSGNNMQIGLLIYRLIIIFHGYKNFFTPIEHMSIGFIFICRKINGLILNLFIIMNEISLDVLLKKGHIKGPETISKYHGSNNEKFQPQKDIFSIK